MYILKAIAAVAAGLLVQTQPVSAHSTERNPLRRLTRIEEPIVHTQSHRIHALSHFELSFTLPDKQQKVRLSLSPNHDIIADGATVQHVEEDGTITIEPINRLDHRVFLGDAFVRRPGHSEWTNAGWARINVHQDGRDPMFEGVFRIDGDHHHVQTSQKYMQTRVQDDPLIEQDAREHMVVWRDSDIIETTNTFDNHDELKRDIGQREPSCSSDVLDYNMDLNHPVFRLAREIRDDAGQLQSVSPKALFGRQIDGTTGGNGAGVNLAGSVGDTKGCPIARKVALVGIATDCTYTKALGGQKANVTQSIIQMVNSASQLYESTFNISLGIANLNIQPQDCPTNAASTPTPWNVDCESGVDITQRLNLFSKWKGSQANDSNAYWTLLSTCPTGAAVGLAWLGQACAPGSQTSGQNETIAAANVVVRTGSEWQVFAHETGHTFGAVHDCIPTTCNDGSVTKQQCCPLNGQSCDAKGQFIMNPSTGSGITKFSPCSVGNICSAIGRNAVKTQCLTDNKNVVTITGSQCGNGIVEAGEDCDCGGSQGCEGNPCCDATTCKFTAGSACDFSNEECCTQQCKLAGAGTVCRPSTGSCDPAETCSGTSAACPANVNAPDGQSCATGLSCASGQCTSRDQQCKTLMGSLTAGNDTYACSSQGCQLSCASPEFGANTCFTMMQNFLDGTTCEGGGKCRNGNCEGASIANEIGSWINDNKHIVIPVACVVGALVLIAIISCIWTSIKRRRRPKAPKPPPPGWSQYAGAWGGAAPQRAARRGGGNRRGGPPPQGQGDVPANWRPVRSMSTRYA